ncbi:DUF2695 domain-containing protein (plasmid) [Rossellomorea sp. AcN35-11]|nr:DUF2695 domain-containing protein [Rossellomorea aquimaris]WJV32029.1 DUF2695 domain-containing protein [Rossellomorea sp. AcN35-11]
MAKGSNKKAKLRAKRKRKEFRNRTKAEQKAAKERKLDKAERNRRFAGFSPTRELPEDQIIFDDFSIQEGREVVRTLNERLFFHRLMERLEEEGCQHDLRYTRDLLKGMSYGKWKIESVIDVLEENGGHCDCEVIYNVYIPRSMLCQDEGLYES